MKLSRTISTHATRLIGIGGVALVVIISISAARLGAASPIRLLLPTNLPTLATSSASDGELLHDIGAAVTKTNKPNVRQVMMEVTAYCPCPKCCGPNAKGITASGKLVSYNAGGFVAADKMFSFGTKLVIPGYHGSKTVEVIDRGGAIKGNKLDVFFPTHKEALQWGRQYVMVTVID